MKRALIVVLAAMLGAGLAIAAFDVAAQTASVVEGRRADLAVFREQFLNADKSYAAPAREEAERRLAALEQSAPHLSNAAFELEIAAIVALADNGHTAAFATLRADRYNRVDIRLAPFGADFYVLQASESNADLLGARLVAIDGRSITQLRALAHTLTGGTAAWRDRYAPLLFESPEQLHALAAARAASGASYRFRLANGRMLTRTLEARVSADGEGHIGSSRVLYPKAHAGWRTLLAPDQAPWALRDPDTPFRMRDAGEIDAFVIEMRQNHNSRAAPIDEFMMDALLAARESGRRNLVLDMRMNGGGDLNITRAWVRRLPRAVPGRVFVLTSPWTFSAAISTTGYLKQSAPDRVTIVGEGVGDRLNFFSEGDILTLPNSGIEVLYATERHDYVTGCEGLTDCHGPVVRNPIRVATLVPDIAAPWTIEAYRAGRDPAMEEVAAALR